VLGQQQQQQVVAAPLVLHQGRQEQQQQALRVMERRLHSRQVLAVAGVQQQLHRAVSIAKRSAGTVTQRARQLHAVFSVYA
jgi:hypothetical protein